MDEATVVFSRQGLFQQRIHAREITSREDARHLWPFVSNAEDRAPVTWVRPAFDPSGKLLRRSHFKHLPKSPLRIDASEELEEAETQRRAWTSESPEHKRAKELLEAELNRRITDGLPLNWAFNDKRASDFHLSGDLLRGAEKIKDEFQVPTAYGSRFTLDLAVLGPKYRDKRLVLGGIEIEKTHQFEGRKCLLGRALAFPLISVDISDMTLDDLTEDWARSILEMTTLSREDGRRTTYIYIHDVLYPIFVQLSDEVRNPEGRHQYLVFASDQELAELIFALEDLKIWLGRESRLSFARVNGLRSEQARKTVQGTGEIVGADWQEYNPHQFLRIALDVPSHNPDARIWLCHMIVARILLRKGRCLIGYQYRNQAYNHNPQEDLWIHRKLVLVPGVAPEYVPVRVLPKRLSDSLERMMVILRGLGV